MTINRISLFVLLFGFCFTPTTWIISQDKITSKQHVVKKWEISVAANSNISFRNWEDLPNPRSFNAFPNILSKVGYGLTTQLNYSLNDAWFLSLTADYVQRNNATETQGYLLILDKDGNRIVVRCNAIDQKIHQLMIGGGVGYRILQNLSLQVSPYLQFDITNQKYKICDFTEWDDDPIYKKSVDFGVSPSLVYNYKWLIIQLSYHQGLTFSNKITFTDEQGVEIGGFGIRNQLLSLGAGVRF
ncbi:MAG: outer membrane beta-barrel protein [Saprospiraceae bacterium]|nr:outer membrane beta-barrel protein [Saprospiraceae bacterium]